MAIGINPDDFLETSAGRVWTPERNAEAWRLSYVALEHAIAAAAQPVRVVLVCGIQEAGKSTWVAAQPASPSTIYVDAALPGIRHRKPIVDIAQRLGATVEAVFIETAVERATARNAARPVDKRVPVDAILAVAAQFEPPTTDEGFARVRVVATP